MSESTDKRTPRKRTTENSVQESPDPTDAAKVMAEAEPAPVPTVSFAESQQPKRVILGGETDPVYASSIIPFNQNAKKSLSVRHLQFRLSELGYEEALVDNEGYYGEFVQAAVARYQSEHDLQETGQPDNGTLSAIFDGDKNVTLHLA